MTKTLKYIPVLLLGSTLGACSMAGTGDYYADQQAVAQTQYAGYGVSSCGGYTGCAPVDSYPVAQVGHQGGYVAPAPVYAQPHTPAPYAYGHALDAQPAYGVPAYAAPQYGAAKGLRQAYTYGSLGAVLYDVDSDLYGAQARLGWQSASIFGAEVEGSLGVNDDDAAYFVGDDIFIGEDGIDNQIAGFGVARLPVSPKFNVLGRVGYHNTEFSGEFVDGDGATVETDYSTDGIAYGIGAEYAFNPLTSLRADYTRYDFDGADADAVSLAIARKF